MGHDPSPPRRRRDLRAPSTATGAVPTTTDGVPATTAAVPTTTGGVPTTTGTIPVAPEHRRRWLVLTLVAVLVAVIAIVGGPWVWANLVSGAADDPLVLSTPTASPTPTGPPAAIDPDGTWQVSTGSQAGYRLAEVLTGEQTTVVGRTDLVTGTMVVADGLLTTAQVQVDTASITTDQSARDVYFRRALDTSTYPSATFTLTEPVDITAVGSASEPVQVVLVGTLTLRGVDAPATAALDVQRTYDGLEVAGTIPVTLADFELDVPDLGFVTVEPTGSVEVRLLLAR